MINRDLLSRYTNAFIMYEIANHGVDPRENLDGTSMRIFNNEGYKYTVVDNWNHRQGNSYVADIMGAFPGFNLVDYHQRASIEAKLEKYGIDNSEKMLCSLYEGDNDADSFGNIVSVLGGSFDLLGFLFFLKDSERYMPIKSQIFDARFHLLDIDSDLAGNCTWEKYQQYNAWIKEIQQFLKDNLNAAITMLDAHSFLWVLPGLKSYLDNESQAVEHSKFGKGIVLGFENDLILVRFGKQIRKFGKDAAFDKGLLHFIPSGLDIYGRKMQIQPIDEETKQLNTYEDDKLVADLQQDELPDVDFQYSGGIKDRPVANLSKGRAVYTRDKQVARNALAHAHYSCELDSNHITFIRKKSGKPYTEPHHLVPMAYQDQFEVSLDREENIVSLCSNCHNEIHYGIKAPELVEKLFNDRKKLLSSIGVEVSSDEILEMYK